jgi:hypothetical protein
VKLQDIEEKKKILWFPKIKEKKGRVSHGMFLEFSTTVLEA